MIRSAFVLLAVLGLAACTKQVATPTQVDACFEVVPHKDGSIGFNMLAPHEPNLESCAGALEAMRLRFLGLGGSNHQLAGVYNTQYLFLDPGGVKTSNSIDGMRFPFLIHADDGHLVAAGADTSQP
jgi:hypothetical protein